MLNSNLKNVIKFSIKIYMLFQLTSSVIYSKKDNDLVKNLQMFNLKFSPLSDIFPAFFHLKFFVFDLEYRIIFAQASEPKLEKAIYENFFRHYKSVLIESSKTTKSKYLAECNLVLTSKIFNRLIRNLTFEKENVSNDSTKVFHLNVHLRKKKINKANELWMKIDLEKIDIRNGPVYRAVRDWINVSERQNHHRFKRFPKNRLVVESCVLIDFTVYELFKNFLLSNDYNYVKMFLELKFSQILLLIDHIYQNMNNNLLEIKIEFTNLFINFVNDFDYSGLISNNSIFLNELSKRTFLKDIEKYKTCDHLFFVHSFKYNGAIGFTKKGRICSNYRLSSITYGTSHFLETVMAHELAHNLGLDHDDINVVFPDGKKRVCTDERYLMSRGVNFRKSFYTFSNCSVQSFENNLLNPKTKTVFDFYGCLIENNPKKWINNYKVQSFNKMPGHFISLSDQCRYFLNFSKSYYCRSNIVNCGTLFCYNKERQCQEVKALLLDGSFCGQNSSCVRGRCFWNHDIDHLVWKGNLKAIPNQLEKGILNLRNNCPGGASLEKYAFNNKVKSLEEQYTKPCSEMIYGNYQIFDNRSLVHLNLYLRTICCEAFMKSRKQICGGPKYECLLPPCEYFKTNPCLNNGKCVNFKSNLHPSNLSFECICSKGFRGKINQI